MKRGYSAFSVRFAPETVAAVDAEAARVSQATGLSVARAQMIDLLVREALAARRKAAGGEQ